MSDDPDLAFRLIWDIGRDLRRLLNMSQAEIMLADHHALINMIAIERLVFEIGEKLEGKDAA